MTQKEKQLLLKDLCARLPYGVKISIKADHSQGKEMIELNGYHLFEKSYNLEEREMRPYLRPMSSMTKEEEVEWFESVVPTMDCDKQLDFYCKYHLDYRGLILKGLALPATEGMYNN